MPTTNLPSFRDFLRIEEDHLAAQLSLVRAAITHAGEKGRGLEHHAITLLRRFLPAEYGLATGFIAAIDSQDPHSKVQLSPQIDVVIYDAIRGGALMDLGSCQVFPLESVLGIVEVKATLYPAIPDLYRLSADVRRMTTRHYLISPVEVDPLREHEREIDSIANVHAEAFIDDLTRSSLLAAYPPPRSIIYPSWMRVRSFAIAFEYDKTLSFDASTARRRMEDSFEDPGHFHSVVVPNVCVASNMNATGHPERLGKVMIETEMPLARFRQSVLHALASFPRPGASMSVDLRPYFRELPLSST